MGKIGWGEFLLILIIAVIVVGPDKLPELGKSLGKAIRSVKKYVSDAANEIVDTEEIKEMKKDIESIKTDVTSIGKDLEKSLEDTRTETKKAVTEAVEETRAAVKDAEKTVDEAVKAANEPVTVGAKAPQAATEENKENNA